MFKSGDVVRLKNSDEHLTVRVVDTVAQRVEVTWFHGMSLMRQHVLAADLVLVRRRED